MSINSTIRANDNISFHDVSNLNIHDCKKPALWARTEVVVGYGKVHNNPTGKSTLDEVIFTGQNTVPLGGVQYVMERCFGVRGPISVPTLYRPDTEEITGIGKPDSNSPTETYPSPDGDKRIIYRDGHLVQLFGIGITGHAENDVTVYPVDYRENSININMTTADGTIVTGTMIPFRHTAEELNEIDVKKYFGKLTKDGITSYFLKRFEQDPAIKHIWKTGEDDENETEVSQDEVWQNNVGSNTVETFTEIILKITKKDVKEWFTSIDQQARARITTIALFNGEYVVDEGETYGDYRDVRMFSKLNIPVEYLSLSKDLNIIYRVYGS